MTQIYFESHVFKYMKTQTAREREGYAAYYCASRAVHVLHPLENQHNTTLAVDVEGWLDHVDNGKKTAGPLRSRLRSLPSAPRSCLPLSSLYGVS